jgi:hypothetical protein
MRSGTAVAVAVVAIALALILTVCVTPSGLTGLPNHDAGKIGLVVRQERVAAHDPVTGPPAQWYGAPELSNPSAQYAVSLAYDPTDNETVLFGGCTPGGLDNLFCVPSNETEALQGGYWVPLNESPSPPPLYQAAMAYDPLDGYVVLFGGEGSLYTPPNETWTFSNGVWTNRTTSIAPPPDTNGGAITYDPALRAMFYYGGDCNATWSYAAGVWQKFNLSGQICPSGFSPVMAYDPTDGYVLYFGGGGLGSPVGTWKFDEGVWTNISATSGPQPQPRIFASMAFDPEQNSMILYGGASAELLPTYYNDTWAYASGTWANVTASAETAGGPTYGALAYDPWEEDLIEYGGRGFGGAPGSTFAYGPPLLQVGWGQQTSLVIDADHNTTVSATIVGGTPPLQVVWEGGNLNCPLQNSTFTVCAPMRAGSYNLTVAASDADPQYARSYPLAVTVSPPLNANITGPSSVTVGAGVTFTANASGGTPPYAFDYSGLPSGCSVTNQATFSCNPNSTGQFTVRLSVTDAAGGSVNISRSLNVEPQLFSPAFFESTSGVVFLVVVGVLVAVVVGLLLRRRGRKRGGTSVPPPDTGTAGSGAAAGPATRGAPASIPSEPPTNSG